MFVRLLMIQSILVSNLKKKEKVNQELSSRLSNLYFYLKRWEGTLQDKAKEVPAARWTLTEIDTTMLHRKLYRISPGHLVFHPFSPLSCTDSTSV